MHLFPSSDVLGLDIGRRFVKALLIRKGKAGVEVLKACSVRIESSPQDTPELKKDKTLEALNKVMAEVGKKPRKVGIACPGQVVFPRLVKLPPVAKGKLKQIVQYEAQQQIPFSLEEVIWGYHILPSEKKAEMRALILAVKKEIVDDILALTAPLKLNVEFLGFTPLAVYTALCFKGEIAGDKTAAVVDIGAQSTEITIVEGGEIAMVRTIPSGGDTISQAIAHAFRTDFYEAEKMKQGVSAPVLGTGAFSEKEKELFAAVHPVLENLMDEIRRSIGYYRSQLRGTNIEDIILTGGGAELKNIGSFMEENLRIKVTKTNPFTRASIPVELLSRFPEPSIFSVSMGLGLRLLGEGKIKINLLPTQIIQQLEFRKKEPVLIGNFILILLSLLIYGGIMRQKAFTEGMILGRLDDMLAEYTKLDKLLKPKEDEKKELLSFMSRLEEIARERTAVLNILNEVCYLIPDGIVLESFSPLGAEAKAGGAAREYAAVSGERPASRGDEKPAEIKGGILLKGLSINFDLISYFISTLEASPMFKKVEVDPSSGELIKSDEGEFVKFILRVEAAQ